MMEAWEVSEAVPESLEREAMQRASYAKLFREFGTSFLDLASRSGAMPKNHRG